MGEKFVEDLEGDKMENNDLVSYLENILDINSGLIVRLDIEKKKKRKKRLENDINQFFVVVIVSEINEFFVNVDFVEVIFEFFLILRGNFFVEVSQ